VIEYRHLLSGQVKVVNAERPCLAQNVVIDVRNISHQFRFETLIAETPDQEIKNEVNKRMAKVR
jgi:hypothetical protein